MKLLNKKGSQMVDAAVVTPLFILIIFSLISACIFLFCSLENQTRLHDELLNDMNCSNAIFTIKNKTIETSKNTGGISSIIMRKQYNGRIYIMKQAEMIRIGEMLDLENAED